MRESIGWILICFSDAGINWNDIDVLSDTGINWNDIDAYEWMRSVNWVNRLE